MKDFHNLLFELAMQRPQSLLLSLILEKKRAHFVETRQELE